MSDTIYSLLAGFILAAIVAAAAWRVRALSVSGMLAAALLGTVIFGLGGLPWAIVLIGFFVSSSALSKLFRKQKRQLEEKFSKGSQRDAGQVAANGGIAGVFVLLHVFFPTALWPWWGFAGALAAANADTWATELGVLSPTAPRLITTGRTVEPGESGGISAAGTLAAMGGALFIALLAAFSMYLAPEAPVGLPGWLARLAGAGLPSTTLAQVAAAVLFVTLAGLAGSLLDSLLGATVQAIYYCPVCQKETERHPLHICGSLTSLVRGWPWMDNDWVNLFCTLAGALLAAIASAIRQ